MQRSDFLKLLISTPFLAMELKNVYAASLNLDSTEKMPVLFLGHGSPMNAVEDNEFVKSFRNLSSEIETPKAILVVSAHWESRGTRQRFMILAAFRRSFMK